MANGITIELRKKSNDELAELIVKLKAQLLQQRFSMANGEAEKLHTIQEIRRTIARALTIINERGITISLSKTKQAKKASAAVYSTKNTTAIKAIHKIEDESVKPKTTIKAEKVKAVNKEINSVGKVVKVKTTTAKPATKHATAKKATVAKTATAKTATAKKATVAKTATAKPAAAKKVVAAKKPAAKKPAAKKPVEPVKKPVTKKVAAVKKTTTAKKPAVKKTTAKTPTTTKGLK